MITRTEQIWLEPNNTLSVLCHYSKNLWNEANYQIRQEFFAGNRIPKYCELAGTFKTSDNYQAINSQTGQQILRVLSKNWTGFFKAVKDFAKHPEKYLGKPGIPGYKEKDGEFLLLFTNQQVSIENGYIKFPVTLGIDLIETRLGDNTKIREARIIPKGTGYVCELVYKTIDEEGEINSRWYSRIQNGNRILGIDFGSVNIVTMGNNIGLKPIAIKDDGRGIKSINQYYNKMKAQLQNIYDRQKIKSGSKMEALTEKRNLKIKDAMHKISRYIIDYCKWHNIGVITIGYNENWKQEIELGKRNNQNFVSIPYYLLIQIIEYKAKEAGIIVKLQDEAHTSKCSFLDEESVEHHEKYMGKRIKRGLFRSATGILINADVQGAYNIIRKSEPNAFQKWYADGVGGCGLHPMRVNPLGSIIS
jgi:putative transposase